MKNETTQTRRNLRAPRCMHPCMNNDGIHVPSFTAQENERKVLRKNCRRPMDGMRFLKVMVEETSTYDEIVNKNDRAQKISVPYKESYMVALITIHNGHAYIQDVTTSGRLCNYRPIPCNGSVSRKDIMDAIGIHDSYATRVYACKVKAVR